MSSSTSTPHSTGSLACLPRASRIPLAQMRSVYDCDEVQARRDKLNPQEHANLLKTYERMLSKGAERFQVKPSGLPAMEGLYDELPNFHEVLDDVRRQVALCADSGDALEITPLLLLGPPGIGKTHFARQLADLLGTGHGFVSMGQLTAGWLLGGASSQWKGAKPGKVFEALVDGDYANPVMVIDEIDKAAGEASYDPLGALYNLLEHDTACRFVDEFAEVPLDASQLIWVATANDARAIPEPILNRCNVYEIEAPDFEAARAIALRLYQRLRTSHDWGRAFCEAPGDKVLDLMAAMPPREMRRAWMTAFGNAKLAGRDAVEAADLPVAAANKRRPIGF